MPNKSLCILSCVHISKTKVMFVTTQNKDKSLQSILKSFKSSNTNRVNVHSPLRSSKEGLKKKQNVGFSINIFDAFFWHWCFYIGCIISRLHSKKFEYVWSCFAWRYKIILLLLEIVIPSQLRSTTWEGYNVHALMLIWFLETT